MFIKYLYIYSVYTMEITNFFSSEPNSFCEPWTELYQNNKPEFAILI